MSNVQKMSRTSKDRAISLTGATEVIKRDHDELLVVLATKLITLGGLGVSDVPQKHLKQVVDDGRQFTERVQLEAGERDCHENAVKLWAEDPEANLLVTGYGLTRLTLFNDEGPKTFPMWVVHTWVLRGETLIETAHEHDAYFGVVLSATDAFKSFAAGVMSRECSDGKVTAEILKRYAHLQPIAVEAIRESVNKMAPKRFLDLLASYLSPLGEKATSIIENLRAANEAGTLTPDVISDLKACVVESYDPWNARAHKSRQRRNSIKSAGTQPLAA
jgi:hypothetical protein